MQISSVAVHNFRSFIDAKFDVHNYVLLVGANNCGKSTLINAIRIFYDDLKWSADDWPKTGALESDEAWIEIEFILTEREHDSLPDKYHRGDRTLLLRKFLKSPDRVRSNQSNIFSRLADGTLDSSLFFGAKNISQAKLGSVVYIPALSVPGDNLKTSGPSPFRTILAFILRRMVASSSAYSKLIEAFAALNVEARAEGGILKDLAKPINEAICNWGITIELDVRSVTPDDFAKMLIQHSFNDQALNQGLMPIDRFGQGFQRTVIYELIRLAPTFKDAAVESSKKEFDPDFTMILFEEPEAFLHPDQQTNLALALKKLSCEEGRQILISTHSPIFVSKSAADLTQIVRIFKCNGISYTRQLSKSQLEMVFGEGRLLARALQEYIDDHDVPEQSKSSARKLLSQMPEDEIAEDEERFRYQLWLDGERAAMFFASRVIICEGASEKCLLSFLLESDWSDLRQNRVTVVDALGKFNMHRFQSLLSAFAIPYAVIMDGDKGRDHHAVINKLVNRMCAQHTAPEALIFEKDIEDFLGLEKPVPSRSDRKPIQILSAAVNGKIDQTKLAILKIDFERICTGASTRTF